VVWLYRTPYNASNLEVTPDSVEYALAPLQLLETGRYEIMMQGRGLPPRYPPWFPALVILPAYVLFGHDPGNAILPITLFAVAGIGFAYAIGKRISGPVGGILSALAVLALPSYSFWSTEVMSDIPCTALMLGTCLLYLHLRALPESVLLNFAAGLLVAMTALFRPVFAAMLLPFLLAVLRQRKSMFARMILLLTPMLAAAAATFVYNAATFGSPLRNGYKYWVPVPMDYPQMVFSFSYLRMNLALVGFGIFPILLLVCFGAWLLARTRRPAAFHASQQSFAEAMIFFALMTTPILVFHLLYFFPAPRFHIPMFAGTAVLAGSMVALVVGPQKKAVIKFGLAVVLVLAVTERIVVPQAVPYRRLAADEVRKHTPENGIIISAIDPVYLERMTGRRILPLSREVEYAWVVLVKKRVDDSRLRVLSWDDGRAVASARPIIRPHAEEAVRYVASEQADELHRAITAGTPVFLEANLIEKTQKQAVLDLRARFTLVERAPNLYQLQSP
jgi:4-amino-4-deoxy-L-arabinose transferase-like glycosyltransferase